MDLMERLRAAYSKFGIPVLIILIFVVSIFIRIFHPYADPPVDLDNSGGLFFDEGALAHNARNKVMYGQWRIDRWNNMVYSPVQNFLVYVSFKLFGIGLLQERMVPITLSILMLGLFYLALRENYGQKTALLGLLLLGLNFPFSMFNRLGLAEIPFTFACVLSLYLFQKGMKNKPACIYLAGLSSFLAFVFKNFAYYLILAAFLTIAVYSIYREKLKIRYFFRDSILFGGGILTLFFPWYFIFYYPNAEEILAIGELQIAQSIPASGLRLLLNILSQPFLIYLSDYPILLLAGFGFAFYVLYQLISHKDRVNAIDLFAVLWLSGGIGFFSIFNYRPVRYYVPLIPPLCIFASRAIMILIENHGNIISRLKILRFNIAAGFFYFIVFLYFLIPKFRSPYLNFLKSLNDLLIFALLTSLILCLASMIFIYLYNRMGLFRRFIVPVIVIIFLAVNLATDSKNYYEYIKKPKYVIYNTSRELGEKLDSAFISGLATPVLVLENKHRALYAGREGWLDGQEDIFKRYRGISHIFAAVYNNEIDWYFKTFPDIMLKAELIKVYNIWKSEFFFFSLKDKTDKMKFYSNPSDGHDAIIIKSSFPATSKVNEKHEVWIEVKNSGKNPWLKKDGIKLGAIGDSDPFASTRHLLADDEAILPGQSKMFSFQMKAPRRAGIYATDWRMVKENSFWFGEPLLKIIHVKVD